MAVLMARRLVLVQILILIVGAYLATCVVMRPPLYIEDQLIEYGFPFGKPDRVISVTYESQRFPRAGTFAPSFYFDWAGYGSGGAHHWVTFYVDFTRTILWIIAIILGTFSLLILCRRWARRLNSATSRGFEIVIPRQP